MTDANTDPFGPPPQENATPATPPPPPPKASVDYTSLSLHKTALIAGLAIATILPNLLIGQMIEEREQRADGVRAEFSKNWGPEQNLMGPFLVVPYQVAERPRVYVKIAASRLDLNATLNPQERKRGLFHATVYDTKVALDGAFAVPAETRLREFVSDKDGRFIWNEAMIAFGTRSRLTGLSVSDNIAIDGTPSTWVPCLEALRQETVCRHTDWVLAKAPLTFGSNDVTRLTFKAVVSLRGTSSFTLYTAAKELNATIRSSWPSPSFSGSVLPDTSTVAADGFDAKWRVTEFGSPRVTTGPVLGDSATWASASIGVDLIDATPIYRMITRVSKYGLLFVILSFATYFFFEVLARMRIHVVQYGLLGVSLSLFGLLLLSLAEPVGYTNGYLISAGLVLAQSTLYTAAVARRVLPALLFAGMLASLFGFLYVLLGLETYSLLIGALALFVVVSALMVLTQMVRWPGRPLPNSAQA